MVDFLDRDVSSILQVHLAEGMLVDVLLVSVAATGEVIVVLLHQFLVRGAVPFAIFDRSSGRDVCASLESWTTL